MNEFNATEYAALRKDIRREIARNERATARKPVADNTSVNTLTLDLRAQLAAIQADM